MVGDAFTLMLDCTWAYSTTGHMLDLRDPANPKLLPGRWRDQVNTETKEYVSRSK